MTTTFSVTRDQVIQGALRILGVVIEGQVPTTEQYTTGTEALNYLLKSWNRQGLNLWTMRMASIPLDSGTALYTLGPTGSVVMDRPLKILNAYIRTSSGNDTPITPVTKAEYNMLGSKTSQGRPNQFHYDPYLNNGTILFYPVPNDSTLTAWFEYQAPISDIAASTGIPDDIPASTDIPEVPQEAYQALKWGLADQLSLEYGVDAQTRGEISTRAALEKKDFFDYNVEDGSITFQPFYSGRY